MDQVAVYHQPLMIKIAQLDLKMNLPLMKSWIIKGDIHLRGERIRVSRKERIIENCSRINS
jgi:hypothetical protein